MPLSTATYLMSAIEFLLWASVGYLFWAKKLNKRFPAMSTYLALHIISMPILMGALILQSRPGGDWFFPVYFYGTYAVYIASAVILYFVCLEIFRYVLSAFSGLLRFGIVIFRWAALVSLIMSLTTVSFAHRGILVVPDLASSMMRSVSLLELCLLAFLGLSLSALQLPLRDISFGIALGLGVMATNDFVVAALMKLDSKFTDSFQLVYQAVGLIPLGVWIGYSALPEPVRKPLVIQANSTIFRLNEILMALGQKGVNVAVQQPANSFFLTDVEKVVEKVLNRNLKESESKAS